MTTIDIYARVSRMSDKRDLSTNGQVIECRGLVAERGYDVGEVHVDSGKSAWNTKVFRPGWHALMSRLDNGEADGVIVFEMSRFARRQEEGLRLLRLAQAGALVLDSENEYDLTKPRQAKGFSEAIVAAEYESAMISLRTKRGKKAKVRDTQQYNNGPRPFGFEVGNIVPREDEAQELRSAARRLLKGESALSICADLNARNVQTTFGNIWKPPSLRVTLLRPCNVGDVTHNGVVIHAARYPGILQRDVYERLVAMYGGRRRGRPVVNLATGFVQCEDCGRTLHAKALYRSTIANPDGSPVKAYSCVRSQGGCGQMIDWFDLESFVKQVALTRLSDPKRASAIEAKAAAVDSELDQVATQIAELEATAEEVGARLGRRQITLKRHDAIVTPLDEQLVKLYAKQEALQASAPHRASTRKLESRVVWEKRWTAADITTRRDIVRQAFDGQQLLVSARPRTTPARTRCRFGV